MTRKLVLGTVVALSLVVLPVAIGDFAVVPPARADRVPVPEPGTLTLLSAGLLGLAWRRRRQ
jgi:hypothetical protein